MYAIYIISHDRYAYAPLQSGYLGLSIYPFSFYYQIHNNFFSPKTIKPKTKKMARIYYKRFLEEIKNYADPRHPNDFILQIIPVKGKNQ